MKKKTKLKTKDFDRAFDEGKASVDFSKGVMTKGLSKIIQLPPLTVPSWVAVEIESISKLQANSKSAVIRQLLVEAILLRHKTA